LCYKLFIPTGRKSVIETKKKNYRIIYLERSVQKKTLFDNDILKVNLKIQSL